LTVSTPIREERPVNSPASPIGRASKVAGAALWIAALALAVAAAGKIGLYGRFQQSAADACEGAVDREPAGGWPDASFPCEQFAPLGWYLPYWLTIAAYVVFTVLFAVAAVKAARASRDARRFAAVTGGLADLICVLPGVLGLSWIAASATANEADQVVVESIRDDVPGWFTATEWIALVAVFAASGVAAIALQRGKSWWVKG
jgi:hypothetical protein